MSLPAPERKREVVQAMFDRIAPRYDLMNRLMTFGADRAWRRAAIASLALQPGDVLLDLACGTGDLAEAAAPSGALVIGVDFAREMLRGARHRGLRCSLVRGDALALPLRDASCNALVSGFALRNFSDLRAALRECARVLRPGGRAAFLEVDTPRSPLLRLGHRLYFERLVPLLGRLVSDREAYRYLPSSVVYLPPPAELLDWLRAAGFSAVERRGFLLGSAQLLTARREGGGA